MDDYYCQCTEGRQQILDSGVGCLCQSTCSTTELLGMFFFLTSIPSSFSRSLLQAGGVGVGEAHLGSERER